MNMNELNKTAPFPGINFSEKRHVEVFFTYVNKCSGVAIKNTKVSVTFLCLEKSIFCVCVCVTERLCAVRAFCSKTEV